MPRTKLQDRIPNFDGFRKKLFGKMGENRLTMDKIGKHSRVSYYRWLDEPWRFSMDALADMLNTVGFTQEEQEDIVIKLYREVKKKVA